MREGQAALEWMLSLAASSYGPRGRSKIVRVGGGRAGAAVTVTTTSHRLFAALRLEHPAVKVLGELVAARQARGADCGLFTVLIASSLLIGADRRSTGTPSLFFRLRFESLRSTSTE